MAYQNVGTPRFYVNYGAYHSANNFPNPVGSYFEPNRVRKITELNPTIPHPDTRDVPHYFQYPDLIGINYVFFLGHKFNTDGNELLVNVGGAGAGDFDLSINISNILNDWNTPPELDGWSLGAFDDFPFEDQFFRLYINGAYSCNSICFGRFYDMPHSPDLSLNMSIEMDGIKNIKTKGGVSLTSSNYTKPQNWGDGGAWQLSSTLDDGTQSAVASNLRQGRRSWDLSFSYLSDSDVFPVNATTSNPLNTNPDDNTLLNGTDFFSQVWNRTMGGHLPFIFQPDGSNANPDQFAICRFDMNSLQYDQVANNVYNVKLKIREVW